MDQHRGPEAEHGRDHEVDERAPEVFAPAYAAQRAREFIGFVWADIVDCVDIMRHEEEGGEEVEDLGVSPGINKDSAQEPFENQQGEIEEKREEHHHHVHRHEQFEHDMGDGRRSGVVAAGVVNGALGDGDMGLLFEFRRRLDQLKWANEFACLGVVFGLAAWRVGDGRASEGKGKFIREGARTNGGEIIMGRAEVFIRAAAEGSGEIVDARGFGRGRGFAEAQGAVVSDGMEVFEGGNIAKQAAMRALDGPSGHVERHSETSAAVAGEANEVVAGRGWRGHVHSITTERGDEFS